MDLILESFKRLYKADQINDNTLLTLINNGLITEKDKEYIQMEEGE